MMGVDTKLFQTEKRMANQLNFFLEASKRSKIETENLGIVHNEYSKK
jgi:hypothetical protein